MFLDSVHSYDCSAYVGHSSYWSPVYQDWIELLIWFNWFLKAICIDSIIANSLTIWFLKQFDWKISVASQIAWFLRIRYHHSGLIFWLHFLCSSLSSLFVPNEQVLAADRFWSSLLAFLDLKLFLWILISISFKLRKLGWSFRGLNRIFCYLCIALNNLQIGHVHKYRFFHWKCTH